MPLLIALIIFIFSLSTVGGFLTNEFKMLPGQASISQILETFQVESSPKGNNEEIISQPQEKITYYYPSQTTSPKIETKTPSPVEETIDTYIRYGPIEGEVIDETNEVIFEFKEILKKELEGQVVFETKVLGLDNNWQKTYSNERKILFPGGVKTYTFLVRTRIGDLVDLTPAERTFTIKLSSYFDKVKITSLQRPDPYNNPSLITLSTYLQKGETVNMTGWEFKGSWGSFEIPASLEDYNPLLQSFTLKDVILRQGDIIYISSENNPLGPRTWNFRPNKCMGYLTNSKYFPIPISQSCPSISSQRLTYYLDDCCREFISTLGSCETPKFQDMADYGLLEDDNCKYYLTSTFSYAGCYANHYQEPNFTLNQWHIYTDRVGNEIMDFKTDTIVIKDQKGLLVYSYSYGASSCKELCQ